MKPFHAGRTSFRKPKLTVKDGHTVLKGNPYEEGTKDYRDWEFGWNKAFNENLLMVKKREKRTV